MKPFLIPQEKTIYGRIANAKLNHAETDIRLYILEHFREEGKAPSMKKMTNSIPNMSMFHALSILEKLNAHDIIFLKDNKILLSYPFSNAPTNFRITFKEDQVQCYALCATDALGIPFMYNEDIIIETKCPDCEREIIIEIENLHITKVHPKTTLEYVSIAEKEDSSAHAACPFLNFFCNEEHAHNWAKKNKEHAKGEIYTLDEAMEHGQEIFGTLLLSL